jgi:DNA-binding XRE family transcriptional regulator
LAVENAKYLPIKDGSHIVCASSAHNRVYAQLNKIDVFPFSTKGAVCTLHSEDEMNLRKLRRDSMITQHALAKKTGIPRVKICHAELGIVTLRPDEVLLIRKVLLEMVQNKSARALAALSEDGVSAGRHSEGRLRSEA